MNRVRLVALGDGCRSPFRAIRAALVLMAMVAVLASAPAADALTPPQIYWTNSGTNTIGEANLDGSGVNQSFITGANGIRGIAVDGQYIYWANDSGNTIGRANLDGTGVNPSFITGASTPEGVTVNNQHVYWINDGTNTVGQSGVDGSGVNQDFIATGTSGGAFGLAVGGQHIYWATVLGNTIARANLDGTGVNQSFITGASTPEFVAVDGQHIYWANQGTDTIGEANLDGTGVNQSFITGANGIRGIAVDGQYIYWANESGNTIGRANLDGTGVNQSFITGASTPVAVAVSVPVAQVSPSSPPTFSSTPQGTLSQPETLTISNTGQQELSITGLTFTGADPGDFVLTANGCLGSVAPAETCELTVGFSPQAQGPRSATLEIASNDYANSPLQVPLSGTGGSLPQGPQGTAGGQGPAGVQGPTGAQGPPGSAGKVELIDCKTLTKRVKGRKRELQKCVGRLVSGTVKFTTTTATRRATLSRGRTVYAAGVSIRLGRGMSELLLSDIRPLRRGRYLLTVRAPHHGRWNVRRIGITID